MGRWCRSPPQVEEEKNDETSTGNTNIHNLSDKEFREEILRIFNELKETMEQKFNTIQEDMKEAVDDEQPIKNRKK